MSSKSSSSATTSSSSSHDKITNTSSSSSSSSSSSKTTNINGHDENEKMTNNNRQQQRQQQQQHERGTPRHPSRHPTVILVCLWLFCVVASSLSFVSEINDKRSIIRAVVIIINCGLGAASAASGIYYVDSGVHIMSLVGSMIISLVTLPIIEYTDETTTTTLPPPPLLLSPLTTLLLLLLLQKFNKNSPLSPPPPFSSHLSYLLPLVVAFSLSQQSSSHHPSSSPTLTAANTFTCLCIYLALVNCSIHTTTSGQFRMVSLDALSMIVTILCPLSILYHRFLEAYADRLSFLTMDIIISSSHFPLFLPKQHDYDYNHHLLFSLGLPLLFHLYSTHLLNSLIPLSSHLLGLAYTHGQRHQPKLTLTCHLRDLIQLKDDQQHQLDFDAEASRQRFRLLVGELSERKARLHVFATMGDVMVFEREVERLVSVGCGLGLLISSLPNDVDDDDVVEEVWRRRRDDDDDIPRRRWFRCMDRTPHVVRWACEEKGMTLGLWSYRGRSVEEAKRHVEERDGGCVLFVESLDAVRGMVKEFGDRLVLLDEVCKEDCQMDLK